MAFPSEPSQGQSRGGSRRAILAIDYGRERIGLALSDESRLTARPLADLDSHQSAATTSRDCVNFADIMRVGSIVVGWPLHLDGTPGAWPTEAARFAERVRKQLGLPVELLDERLSSWEAGRDVARSHAAHTGADRRGRKEHWTTSPRR